MSYAVATKQEGTEGEDTPTEGRATQTQASRDLASCPLTVRNSVLECGIGTRAARCGSAESQTVMDTAIARPGHSPTPRAIRGADA